MSLINTWGAELEWSFPRVSGDEPKLFKKSKEDKAFSPREWG